MRIAVDTLISGQIEACIGEVASLRVAVFREYPYRYEGSADYERDYLARYARSDGAIVVVARAEGRIVGASTGLPLVDSDPAFRAPFEHAGIAADEVFYFGESVLLPHYRGRGVGHRFFDERERYAAGLGFRRTAFCAVDRPVEDPARPPGYRPLDEFWKRRGYKRRSDLVAEFDWLEIGEADKRTHRLTFWLRDAGARPGIPYQR